MLSPEEIKQILVGVASCVNCSAIYSANDIKPAGQRAPYYFFTCRCHLCGTQGVGIVLYGQTDESDSEKPLTQDDILAAHEVMKAPEVHLSDLEVDPGKYGL